MAYSLCSSSVANLGEQACDKSRGVGKKLFIFNGTIAEADCATPAAFLAKMVANSKLSKIDPNKVFPINEIQDIADNSEANTEGTFNLGFKTTLREGKPAYTFKVAAGSDLLKRLRTFNNQTIRVIEYAANGTFWGTKIGTGFKGFQVKLFFSGNKIATGQAIEEGFVTVTMSVMSVSEYFDNAYWVGVDGNVEDIVPLIDVEMKYISKASNVYKIGLQIAGSNLAGPFNVFDEVGAAVAALAANFSAGTGTSYGTTLGITSIAVDNSLKALTVTFDSTAFAALSSGAAIRLTGPTPTQLDGGNVPGTELLSVVLTK